MSWTLFCQIVLLSMWFYLLGYALIEGYFKKKYGRDAKPLFKKYGEL